MFYLFRNVILGLLCALGLIVMLPQHSMASRRGSCINVPATPAYLSSRSESDAIAAINHARGQEGLPSLRLPANFYRLGPGQQQLLLINRERIDRGLRPLRMNRGLTGWATSYSREMHTYHFVSHVSPVGGSFANRVRHFGVLRGHRQAAENLAGNPVAGAGPLYEYMYNDVAEGCSHRANILDPSLKEVGIGVVADSYYGSVSAQEFLS